MGLLGFLGDAIGTIGGIGSMIPGPWQIPAAIATAGVGALKSAGKEKQASKLNHQALDLANQRYGELAPFRSQLSALARQPITPEREDLSALFADPGNPYARALPRPAMPSVQPPMQGLPGPMPPQGQAGGFYGPAINALRNRARVLK